jgi:hypothetical protein
MARISTYAIDNNVTSQDKWIGTDSNCSVTKNFTPQGVADWINATNAVGIAGQINYKFQADLTGGRASGTVSFDAGGGDNTAFSAITTFKLSKYNSGEVLILDFLNVLEDEYVLFCQTDNINNFGVYKITDITQDDDETNFYDVALTLVTSNGNLVDEKYYSLISWPYNVTVVDTQLATAAALIDVSAMGSNTTASFTHGLASKNLIVQMYDVTTGEVVFADIDHTSNNAISVIFASTPPNDIRVVVLDDKNGLTDKTVSYS